MLIFAALGVIMVCSSWFIYAYEPVSWIVKKLLTLAPGSLLFHLWTAPPYDIFIKVYLFNVTNPNEFLNGEEKMKLVEIGPYVYRETLTNENATFNDNGTITFHPKRTISYDPERSVGDASVDILMSPNIPLLGVQSMLNDQSMASFGFASFTKMIGSESFLPLTIDEYLWGYKDELIKIAHQFVPSWINFDTFGILERLLAVDNNNLVTISLEPEKENSQNNLLTKEERMQQFHISRWNGIPGLRAWGYKETDGNETDAGNKKCMLVEGGFEGTLFPRGMPHNVSFKLFRGAFCRPVPLEFVEEVLSKDGFRAYKLKVSDSFLAPPEEYPENKCFCYKNKCLPKGLGTIAPCYFDIPIGISYPHFLHGAPELLEPFEGLKPNKSFHGSSAYIHPDIGIPLEGHLKIQINLDVGYTKFNSKTRPFNNMVLPLFWVELSLDDLPGFVYHLLNLACHVAPVLEMVATYLLGLLGLAFISGTALFILFFSNATVPPSISLRGEYTAIPIISIPSQYFKSDVRLSK